ncbi:MAG: ABC transporter substrate-binding protein [Rhizobium sp.]
MTQQSTIWTTRCPIPNALSIASARGELGAELARHGVSLQSLATSTDPKVRQSHFVQSQPWFIRQGGNTPPLVSASKGRRVKILGLTFNSAGEGLYALPGSGIERPADIKGKRISLPRQVNDPVDFWQASVRHGVSHVLRQTNLTEDDIEWVDVVIERTYVSRSTNSTDAAKTLWDSTFMLGHQREEAAALLDGRVDLIYSAGSIATLTAGFTGAERVIDVSTETDPLKRVSNSTPALLTTTADLYEERPELVELIVEHVLRSAEWARTNRPEARRIIGIETGLPEDLVENAWTSEVEERLVPDLDPVKIRALELQVDFLGRNGFLDVPVQLDDLIAPEPLARAKARLAAAPVSEPAL